MQQQRGVLEVTSGYMGGSLENPTYEDVSYRNTGHVEVVEVVYDETKINFEQLAKLFFEIHDPTQLNRQGPDIGSQYASVIFYNNQEEKQISQNLIDILKSKGLSVVTKLEEAQTFWKAESYHQDYYQIKGTTPYCHAYIKKF
jgi:peptide methionine sulfoxide reductase msrA/msrB